MAFTRSPPASPSQRGLPEIPRLRFGPTCESQTPHARARDRPAVVLRSTKRRLRAWHPRRKSSRWSRAIPQSALVRLGTFPFHPFHCYCRLAKRETAVVERHGGIGE